MLNAVSVVKEIVPVLGGTPISAVVNRRGVVVGDEVGVVVGDEVGIFVGGALGWENDK